MKPYIRQAMGVVEVIWSSRSMGILCPKDENGKWVHDDSVLDIDFEKKEAFINATKLAQKQAAIQAQQDAASQAAADEADDLAAAKAVNIETANIAQLAPLIKYIAKKVGV